MRSFIAPEPDAPVTPREPPTFSVVIPAYNASATIAGAVESVLGQTHRPAEIIVCDDGSTDDLGSALAPYANGVTIVRKENGGGASALNVAARAASSEFVAILDADDAYLPERLEALAALGAARPDLDLLTTDTYLEADGRITGRFMATTPFETDDQRSAILTRCFPGGWPAVRRERVLALGWNETLRIAYDWDCWLRLIMTGSRVGLVPEPLHVYRDQPGSLTSRRVDSLRERVAILERAGRTFDLTSDERSVLERSLREKRAKLAAAAIATAREGAEGARRQAASVACARGVRFQTRVKALAVAIAPRVQRPASLSER